MNDAATTPFLVHRIVQVCTSCGSRYSHYLKKPLESGGDAVAWLKKNVVRFCPCNVATCDVELRFKCPSCPHDLHTGDCESCGCKDHRQITGP